MAIKISQLNPVSTVWGNVVVPLVSSISGANVTYHATVDQVKDYVTADVNADIVANIANVNSSIAQANLSMRLYVDGQIFASNTATFLANTGMQGYVDQSNLVLKNYVDGQIIASNVATLTANIGIVGFVNQSNLVLKNYVDGQIAAANAGVVAANLGMQGYVDRANTIQNTQITQANLGMQGYVDLANTIQNTQIVQANIGVVGFVNQSNLVLKNYTDGQIAAANAGIVAANLGMQGYVNLANSIQNNQILQANLGVIGYIDQANTIQNNQILQANLGIIGYVDFANTIQNQQITQANLGIVGYIDQANTIQNTQITQANIGMVGFVNQSNTVLRSYIDGQITAANTAGYTNTKVLTYLTSGVAGNIIPSANLVYSLGSPTNQWKDIYVSGNTIFIGGTALSVVAGNLLIGNTPAYSNVQVATYLPTYSGNIANIRIGTSGVLTFADGTTMITAASGTAFGNVNVAAYLNTQGYNLYSNVNVAAYLISTGYVNTNSAYSNANVASYFSVYNGNIGNVRLSPGGFIYFPDGSIQTTAPPTGGSAYGNVNVAAYLNTQGYNLYSNVNVAVFLSVNGYINTNSAYSNANVASYLPTYSGNVANVRLGTSGGITFPNGTRQTSAVSLPLAATSGVIVGRSGTGNIAIGNNAGLQNQSANAVAIGSGAGILAQGLETIAIGPQAGSDYQAAQSVAIGYQAGLGNLGLRAVAIGYSAGSTETGEAAVAVGSEAGAFAQRPESIAIGSLAGSVSQQVRGIAIGKSAGASSQGSQSLAIGREAGYNNQGRTVENEPGNAIAIGSFAGWEYQGGRAIAIGEDSGYIFQGREAIAIGSDSGNAFQGNNSIAIGTRAGFGNLGANSIAIGTNSGVMNLPGNSIVINASGANISPNTWGFFVAPIKPNNSPGNILYYDSVTREITFGTITSGGTIYSNANVASYLSSTQVVIANIRLAASGNIRFPDGSVQTTAASGTGYGNTNVAAYLGATQIAVANIRLLPSGNLMFPDGSVQTTAAVGGGGSYGNVNVVAYLGGNILVGNLTSGSANITLGTSSINPSTGALRVMGGVGIAGNLNIGAGLAVANVVITNPSAGIRIGNLSIIESSGTTQRLAIGGGTGFQIETPIGANITLSTSGGWTLMPTAKVTDSTAATSTNSGAFTVAGGVGIGGSIFAGGDLTINRIITGTSGSNLTLKNALNGITLEGGINGHIDLSGANVIIGQNSQGNVSIFHRSMTFQQNPATIYAGQAGDQLLTVQGNLTVLRALTAAAPVASTSTATGALLVTGGAGVTGNVFIGGGLGAGGSLGVSGQYLQSTGNGLAWVSGTSGTTISNGTSNVAVLSTGGNVVVTVGGSIKANIGSSGVWVGGNLQINDGYFIGSTLIANVRIGGVVINPAGPTTEVGFGTAGCLIVRYTGVSTSASTGALQVAGGAGIGGNLHVGGNLNITSSANIAGNIFLSAASAQLRIGGLTGALYNPASVVAGTAGGTYTVDAISGTVAIGPSATSVSIGGPATFSNNVTVSGSTDVSAGVLTISTVTEEFTSCSGANIGYTISYGGTGSLGNALHYFGSIASNVTVGFSNMPTANGFSTTYSILINQSASAFMANAVTINGVSQTINWLGYVAPTGNANKKDLVSFSLMRTSGTWTVLGSLSSYG